MLLPDNRTALEILKLKSLEYFEDGSVDLMSVYGPPRHFAATKKFGRFEKQSGHHR
jgi:hypothetical protein